MEGEQKAKAAPKKKVSKPKKPSDHPKYSEMIRAAITSLKERGGSSRQAILKYIIANYKVESKPAGSHIKLALRAGVKNGSLVQSKGTGAAGSFKVGEAKKTKKVAKKAKSPKKTKAKKPKKEKKASEGGAEKKAKKPKKSKAKKSPAKAKKPKPTKAKKATKPKAKKTPKKKAAAKKK